MQAVEQRTSLKSRNDFLYLVPIGDIHLGTKNCDEKKLEKIIDWIKNTPNAYWIGMGDYCENIIYHDKRFDPHSVHPRFLNKLSNIANEQANYVAKILYPIKDRCIGLLEGNHEESIRLTHSQDIMPTLCTRLNTRNLGYTCMIRWMFHRSNRGAKKSITIFASHGWGGGRLVGAKTNNLLNMSLSFEADLYLVGHTHEKIGVDREILYLTGRGEPRIIAKKRLFAITGTFYKTYEMNTKSYSEKRGYPPTPTGVVKIRIEPFRNAWIHGKMIELPVHLHLSE